MARKGRLGWEEEADATKLRRVAADIEKIAARLAVRGAEPLAVDVTPAMVGNVIMARRARAEHLPASLFFDPGWDLLLELFLAKLLDERIQITALGMTSSVPQATVHRWIGVFMQAGLVVRRGAPDDARRVYVELTEQACRALGDYFRAAPRISPLLA